MSDIFSFWKNLGREDHIHPTDKPVLAISKPRFDFKCLPIPFYGPLRTAPVVLLYLAPGWSAGDVADAKSSERREFWYRQRQGFECLSGRNPESWWVKKTKCFGISSEVLGTKLAVLEICPYHAKSFYDWPMLAALPSCRVSIGWAQEILFPQARDGKRVVICLRAAKYWGLTPGQTNDGLLFAPQTNRAGYMLKAPMRTKIIDAVRKIVGVKVK